jgi:hypothetical protein
MIDPVIAKWMLERARKDLRKQRAELTDLERLAVEMTKRERGEGGYSASVWHGEGRKARRALILANKRAGMLRRVVNALKKLTKPGPAQ